MRYIPVDAPGHWELGTSPAATPATPVALPAYPAAADPGVTTNWRFAGVAYARSAGSPPVATSGVGPFSISSRAVMSYFPSSRLEAPHAVVVAAFALPPAAWLMGLRRRRLVRRRRACGQCVGCGYDLRATPEAGAGTLAVCPECGRAGDR